MTLLEKNIEQIPSPCYVMEESLLRRNLTLIRSVAQRADVEIILAFKAFALWKSFPIFREYISHTTASSLFEARLAKEEFGSKAHTYSPAYTEEEFDEILDCSSHITFNSMSQYIRFAPKVQGRASIGIRVNPEYSEIETELYNPCAPGSRFGVLAKDLPEQLPSDIEGFHIHCHCESGSDVFARTLEHIEAKFSKWFPKLQWINFGGGHLMTRKDYDVELLIKTLQDFHTRYPHLRIILEPGSAFAWQTGPLVTKVVDIVENAGVKPPSSMQASPVTCPTVWRCPISQSYAMQRWLIPTVNCQLSTESAAIPAFMVISLASGVLTMNCRLGKP